MEEAQDTLWRVPIFRVFVPGCSKTSPKMRSVGLVLGTSLGHLGLPPPVQMCFCRQVTGPWRKHIYIYIYENRYSAVGIATRYGLDARDRSLVGPRISSPVQTGPVGPPNLLHFGYRFFPRGEAAGRGVDNPPHIAPRLKEE